MIRRLSLLCVILLTSSTLRADNWPQFRGPNHDGLSDQKQLPTTWSATSNIAWKTAIPGKGWSQPIVWGDRVIVTTAVAQEQASGAAQTDGPRGRRRQAGQGRGPQGRRRGYSRRPPETDYRWEVHCLDLQTGKHRWKKVSLQGKPKLNKHRDNTYASETPVTDGERIYAYFGMTGLFCYDMEGELLWKKDLGVYPMRSGWGTSSSPVLHQNHLFLQIDSEGESFLVALDAKTGDEQWRVNRDELSTWSTPIVWQNKVRVELVTGGTKKIRSYDPASGKLLWELDTKGGRSSASAAGDRDMLYVGTEERNRGGPDDGGGYLFAVKAGANGELSANNGVAWSVPEAGISMPSPLICQGLVYLLDRRRGVVNCYDKTTGETVYQRRSIPRARPFWASPWAYDDKVFCLDENGTTHVLEAGPKFKLIAQNTIDEQFWSSPAIAQGKLILRGAEHVYCVEDR